MVPHRPIVIDAESSRINDGHDSIFRFESPHQLMNLLIINKVIKKKKKNSYLKEIVDSVKLSRKGIECTY